MMSSDSETVVNLDLAVWRTGAGKLSLKETGELMRSIIRAQKAKRPNREQRVLLAIFTRDPDVEVHS